MSMHLEGPWLTTTGKRKGKKKYQSAEHARKERELDDSWKALQKKWGLEQEQRIKNRALKAPPLNSSTYHLGPPPGRETPQIPSRDSGVGFAAKLPDKVYTGTKIKGIGTMHKSNAVPIFSDEEAVDISRMRR